MCRPDRYNEPQRKLLSSPDLVTLLAVQTTRRGSLSITTTSEDSRLVRQAFLVLQLSRLFGQQHPQGTEAIGDKLPSAELDQDG